VPVLVNVRLAQGDLLGLAWLCEQAARATGFLDGDAALAAALRDDAARLRAQAVDR